MGISNRNRNSIFNAVSAVMLTLVNGVLGVVVTRMVISYYGSDFNGLNSTANQIVNVILIVEGGFTLASNVALFGPYTTCDYNKVNNILYVTRNKFRKIGLLFLGIGFITSIVYTFLAKSNLSHELIFTIILMTIIPAAFNLFYATTYRVLLQTQQKEYIINIITMFTMGLGHIGNIFLILFHGSIWLVRTITMFTAILNSLIIVWYVKRNNKFLKLSKSNNDETIEGTNDVMIQKITGMIYNSAPIIFLSISPSGGTVQASVYAVYNNIFNIIKSLLRAIIDAPRLGIGQMLSETNRENVWNVFVQYEYIVVVSIFITINTAYALIMPFVSIYTFGIDDINYYDTTIALLMTLIAAFELIHIPSGHLMNMAGEFKASRDIQIVSCIVLICCMTLMGKAYGIHGLLYAVLVVSILLAIMEISFVHIKFFKNKLIDFIKLIIPLFVIGTISCRIEMTVFRFVSDINGFIKFGIVITFINIILAIVVSLVFSRTIFLQLVSRIRNILLREIKLINVWREVK